MPPRAHTYGDAPHHPLRVGQQEEGGAEAVGPCGGLSSPCDLVCFSMGAFLEVRPRVCALSCLNPAPPSLLH